MLDLQRRTALLAAALLLVGFATGGVVAGAMTGKLPADAHSVLAAHLNAVLGCFWLASLAFTLPLLRFGETGARRLVVLTALAAYANWLITTIKAFFHVSGVALDGKAPNDAVFVALNAFVVVPSLVAASVWVYGLAGARKPSHAAVAPT